MAVLENEQVEQNERHPVPPELLALKAESLELDPLEFPFLATMAIRTERKKFEDGLERKFIGILTKADGWEEEPEKYKEFVGTLIRERGFENATPSEIDYFDSSDMSKVFLEHFKDDFDLTYDELRDSFGHASRELVEGIVNLTNLVRDRQVESVVFLDKSARPSAYFFRKLWERVNPDSKTPDIKFLNVGTEKSGRILADPLGEEAKWFGLEVSEAFGKALPGKSVLIVDDTPGGGGSLAASIELLKASVPEIRTLGWTYLYESDPLWYPYEDVTGVVDPVELELTDSKGDEAWLGQSVISETYAYLLDRRRLKGKKLVEVLDEASDSWLKDHKEQSMARSGELRKELATLADNVSKLIYSREGSEYKPKPLIPGRVLDYHPELKSE